MSKFVGKNVGDFVTPPLSSPPHLLLSTQWKGINCKQSTRWQHLSQLKASAFFSLQIFFSYETLQLILGTGTAIWWVTEPHYNHLYLWTMVKASKTGKSFSNIPDCFTNNFHKCKYGFSSVPAHGQNINATYILPPLQVRH